MVVSLSFPSLFYPHALLLHLLSILLFIHIELTLRMMFNLLLTSTLLFITLLSTSILPTDALPHQPTGIALARRDVYNPKITNPRDSTVWKVGSKVTVTWHVSSFPAAGSSD